MEDQSVNPDPYYAVPSESTETPVEVAPENVEVPTEPSETPPQE